MNSIDAIFNCGHFILGSNVESIEREVADYHNVRYAVGLASGTDALHLTLRAMGIGEGDEVITTPFTFIATAEAITYVGARPVFVDIDRNTLNIDPSKIEERIRPWTRAIIPVHLFGKPADMKPIMEIARRYKLKVIEDCAQAFGSRYRGRLVGGIGDAGCFSFYPSKNLGACGDGGMVITNNHGIYKKVKLLRNHGAVASYRHRFIGFNSRLDEIQAAILRVKLKHIDDYNRKRREIAGIYTSMLSNIVQCPTEEEGTMHVYHQYTIRTKKRSKVIKALKDHSISSVIYYPLPLHLQEAFRHLGYKKGDFPESERASKEVLSLPIYPELKPEKVRFIARVIIDSLK
ncbi:MAG: DegT/DnrJ/EryC1/StrS family aminotransferase [Thermodesulfovibrionia bacterium]